jgi:hypothetical protein
MLGVEIVKFDRTSSVVVIFRKTSTPLISTSSNKISLPGASMKKRPLNLQDAIVNLVLRGNELKIVVDGPTVISPEFREQEREIFGSMASVEFLGAAHLVRSAFAKASYLTHNDS